MLLTSLALGIPARRTLCCERERAAGLCHSSAVACSSEQCRSGRHSSECSVPAASTTTIAAVRADSNTHVPAPAEQQARAVIGQPASTTHGPSDLIPYLSEKAEP